MYRQDYRAAKLNGIRAASEAHRQLGIGARIQEGRLEPIDVFESLNELNIPTICRPLTGLLGAYINSGTNQGILVTSNRRLPIQRFTAAHELGHFWLKHDESLDSEETIASARSAKVQQIPLQEIEAEAFASEFLLPRSLIVKISNKLGWNKKDLAYPKNVYQLSLRACVSYEATWRALREYNLITAEESEKIKAATPRKSKLELVTEDLLENSWADVINLSQKDHGSSILASPEDTIVIGLDEHTSSGYVWNSLAEQEDVTLLGDDHIARDSALGGITSRKMVFRSSGDFHISLKERRLWEHDNKPLNTVEIHIDSSGTENGLPRVARK